MDARVEQRHGGLGVMPATGERTADTTMRLPDRKAAPDAAVPVPPVPPEPAEARGQPAPPPADDPADRREPGTGEPAAPSVAQPAAPPAAAALPSDGQAPTAAPKKRGWGRMAVFLAIGLAALGGIGYFGWQYWTVGRFMVSTDDAYVQADVTTLVTKVSGYITRINVADNAAVQAGDVLAEIDTGDYLLAVQTAKDKIAAARATVDRIAAQIPAGEAAVLQARTEIAAQNATLARAQADFTRSETLAARDFGSKQNLDSARAARDSALAAVENAKAGLAQALANVDVTRAQQREQEATLGELNTSLASAERDLSFTKIRAPADGIIGNRAIDIGSYVSAGTRAMALVPTHTVYVSANFKETQLADIVPGQEATLSVDALDEVDIKGRVESIAPASGSTFSLLPVENATGNFTKIVQRVPVRIAISADEAVRAHIRPGLSVVVDIDIRTTPPGAQRLGN